MHIPDGYISPQSCVVGFAVAVPAIGLAVRRVSRSAESRAVPQLALASAFSFLIMMFNLPVPGGTTAHAVGAALIAILMGPAAAVVAVSVSLLFQALLFADGGVLAYGANVVNMAVIMPLVGWGLFRLISARAPIGSPRRVVAATAAGYVAMVVAGLATGLWLGVQPLLFHTADGTPLYNPYPLSQAIPAMLVAHMLIAGPAEALVAGAVVFARERQARRELPAPTPTWSWRKTALVGAGLIAATPLGLLATGTAFGEWSGVQLAQRWGALPDGFARYTDWWPYSPLPDYGFDGGGYLVVGYWISAFVGVAVIVATIWAAARLRRSPSPSGGGAATPKT